MSEMRKELEEKLGKRNSIMHIQNVFLTSPLNIYLSRETKNYVVGYEIKSYSNHKLVYKIRKDLVKDLVSKIKNQAEIRIGVDINVQEDYRLSIKSTDSLWKNKSKNVTVRIAPTKYQTLQQLYGAIVKYGWRHTGAGGKDYITFKIPECPIIANSTTITDICYKQIASQISGGGTHGTHTYIFLSPKNGNYEIGTWVRVSNVNKGGNQHWYEYPVNITL